MKVLFALSNENIINSIITRYQQKFKEVISSKNVYYFNAIIKELQRDNSYDSIIISEDLEPISNRNYEAIDSFLIEKLDSISDEAYKSNGEDIPIVFICSDRRDKGDKLLPRLFSMGIYNALIGNDRVIDNVCNLINKPRNKKDAKKYYQIDNDNVVYQPESDGSIDEAQVQSILSYYKKIGNNKKECVKTFEKISEQYDNTQLRLIINYLPIEVKAILEENSPIYQRLMQNGTVLSNGKYSQYSDPNKKDNKIEIYEKSLEKPKLNGPIIIPHTINSNGIKQVSQVKPQNNNNVRNVNTTNNNRYPNNNNMMNAPRNNMNLNTNMNQWNRNPNQNRMQNGFQNNMQQGNMQHNGMIPPFAQNNGAYNNNFNINNRQSYSKLNPIKPYNPYEQQNQLNQSGINSNTNQLQHNDNNINKINNNENNNENKLTNNNIANNINQDNKLIDNAVENKVNETTSNVTEPIAKKRGRPRTKTIEKTPSDVAIPKKKRGRPKKEVVSSGIEIAKTQAQETNDMIKPETNQVENKETNNIIHAEGSETNQKVNPINNFNNNFNNSFNNSNNNISSSNINNNINNNNFNNFNDRGIQNNNNIFRNETSNNINNNKPIDLFTLGIDTPENVKENNNNTFANEFNNNSIYSSNENFNITPNNNATNLNNNFLTNTNINSNIENNYNNNFSIAGKGKLVTFVGTTKNGTSFIVNNIAKLLSDENIKVAIVDLSKNKDSYYLFTDNDPSKTSKANIGIENLSKGINDGLVINNYLTLFTSLPGRIFENGLNIQNILNTLKQNYDIALFDCDFETDKSIFEKADEIYLVQSMNAFTIQPLTEFLYNLQSSNINFENKLQIVINKYIELKKLDLKTIIGGMSKYNSPSMTMQKDLFNAQNAKYTAIPFDIQTYSAYLEVIAFCKLSLNNYSREAIESLTELKNKVFPLIGEQNKDEKPKHQFGMFGKNKKQNNEMNNSTMPYENYYNNDINQTNNSYNNFSSEVNSTLDKMRKNNY